MEGAFRSFNIGKEKVPQQQAVSNSDDDMLDTANDDDESTSSSLEDELLLTDKERAERKVMLELVFGKSHYDVVEAKLQEWIRRTAREATTTSVTVNHIPSICLDDMHLPSAATWNTYENTKSKGVLRYNNNRAWFRQRSNSLPTDVSVCSKVVNEEVVMEENGKEDEMDMSF
jgi:hypothetical protein